MRFLYSMSRRLPTIMALSDPAMAAWKSGAFFSSCVALAGRMRSSGISSVERAVIESVARSVAASPNFFQLARRSVAACGDQSRGGRERAGGI